MFDSTALEVNIIVHCKSRPKLSDFLYLLSFTPQHVVGQRNFKTTWYISRGSLLQGYRVDLRMIYCPCIFLQNRSKCSQWYTRMHMCACARAYLHSYWINLHSCLLFSLIYMVCEWLLNRVGSLVEELGNGPFLRTQWNRSRAAYVGIWMVNRWITQSGVFLCRLAGIV